MPELKFSDTITRTLALVADEPRMPPEDYAQVVERLRGNPAALAVAQHLAGRHQTSLDQVVEHDHRAYAASLRQFVRARGNLHRIPTFRRV